MSNVRSNVECEFPMSNVSSNVECEFECRM